MPAGSPIQVKRRQHGCLLGVNLGTVRRQVAACLGACHRWPVGQQCGRGGRSAAETWGEHPAG